VPKILQDAFWGEISIFEKKLSQGKFEKYLEIFLVDVHLIDHCALSGGLTRKAIVDLLLNYKLPAMN
jgi:hypothetical protein